MRSTSAGSIALIALFATPAFTTPIPVSISKTSGSSSSSGGAIGTIAGGIAGGAASGIVGNLLNQIEGLFSRDELQAEHAKRDIASIIQNATGLSPDDKQTVKTALINKINTLKESGVAARGIGGTIGGAVAGGATSAVVGNLLSQIESLFRRDSHLDKLSITHELSHGKRDLPSIIKDASSLSPSDKQTVKNALMNKISLLKESDIAARGAAGAIGGAVAGGAASAVVGNLLSEIESLFRREAQLEDLGRRALSVKPSSSSGSSGSGIGGAIAGGAASAAVGNLLNKIEGLFGRDDQTRPVPIPTGGSSGNCIIDEFDGGATRRGIGRRGLSIKPSSSTSSSGSGIGGAIAGGAASAVVGNLLNQIEGLFSRDDHEGIERRFDLTGIRKGASALRHSDKGMSKTARDLTSIIKDASSLPPTDKETVKTALMNKIGTLQEPNVAARGLAGGAASTAIGGVTSIATNTVVSSLLNKIESLFRRDHDELAARDLAARIAALKPEDKETVKSAVLSKLKAQQISNLGSRGVFGNGIGGAIAGGAASGIAGNLLHELEGLITRDDSLIARTEGWAINELD